MTPPSLCWAEAERGLTKHQPVLVLPPPPPPPPCANWSVTELPTRVLFSTLCPSTQLNPCTAPPGAMLGCRKACAGLEGNALKANAWSDAGCGSGPGAGNALCGGDTGIALIIASRSVRIRYAPPAEGVAVAAGAQASLFASGHVSLDLMLNKGVASGACASAGAYASLQFQSQIALHQLASLLSQKPLPVKSLSGDFCQGSSVVTLGASFGWPHNTVGGSWQYPLGGNVARKSTMQPWFVNAILCIATPSVAHPVTYYVTLSGQAMARAAINGANKAEATGVARLSTLTFSFIDPCEACDTSMFISGQPEIHVPNDPPTP